MNKKNIFLISLIFLLVTTMLMSCVKDKWEIPDKQANVYVNFADSTNYTVFSIYDLKQMYDGDTTVLADTVVIEGTVISDDNNGNFYKIIYLQDSTGGIAIQIDMTGLSKLYPVGQKIAIKCGGLYLGEDGGMKKLGSMYKDGETYQFGRIQGIPVVDNHLFKMTGGLPIVPKVVKIQDLASLHYCTLIKIENSQFATSSLKETYAHPSLNALGRGHYIQDYDNNKILLYSSSYSSFAGDTLPEGSGNIVGVYAIYGADKQLYIRDIKDVEFNNLRMTNIYKDFEDGSIYSGGWFTRIVKGTLDWKLGTIGGKYVMMSNYVGGKNYESEVWFISPATEVAALGAKTLSFRNAYKYSGAPLELMISNNYSGEGDPNLAQWTKVPFTISAGNFAWANSGTIDLSAYTGTIHVAFKYTGATTNGSTWEVDDIKIK